MPNWSKQNCVMEKSPMGFKLNPNISCYKSQGQVRFELIGRGNVEMQIDKSRIYIASFPKCLQIFNNIWRKWILYCP